MSDKPRVYQGVRVKTTVKELLQRHRAREANSRKVKTISQACLDLQDLCASTFPGRHADPPSAGPAAASFQLHADPLPSSGGSCSIPLQDSALNDIQQQFGDMMLPGNGFSGPNYTGGGCFSTPLPPPASLPAPWCHGLSSDADYYGPGLAPCSSTESLKLCQPVDHSSYSPHDSFSSSSSSFSSSSSSCYDSPTRMESSFHGFPSEHFNYQHCNLQDCYCLAHWPGQQGGPSAPEYGPYSSPSDYPYACPVDEGYLKRELQMSSEMCYNIL